MRRLLLGAALVLWTAASAFGLDTFIYGTHDTGRWGNYGPTGFVGPDGISRVICYSIDLANRINTAYIYRVTVPDGSDPETHPDNPSAPGAVAPRTFVLEQSFQMANYGYQHSEFYVADRGKTLFFGPAYGIEKYVFDAASGSYQYRGMVAPEAPSDRGRRAGTLAYDKRTNIWYTGTYSYSLTPGATPRQILKYDGNQGPGGQWELAFTYYTPFYNSYHDGLEMVNGLLYLADNNGAVIYEYTTGGELRGTYPRGELYNGGEGSNFAGMGFGALQHFWYGSPWTYLVEFGGGVLERHVVNNPPVAVAGAPLTITTEQQAKTIVDGSVTDPDGGLLLCRWLQGGEVLQDWTQVGEDGACPLILALLPPYPPGVYPLTIEGIDDMGGTDQDQTTLTVTEPPQKWSCSIPAVTISNTSWNSFKVPAGTAPKVWVHAHIGTPKGIPTDATTLVRFSGASLSLNGTKHPLPDALMIFDPAAPGTITTSYDRLQNLWTTVINPRQLSNEIFITGAAIPVTPQIAAGAKATFSFSLDSQARPLSFPWQWSAGVYTAWPTDWNHAGIQPYHGSYHSGAPTDGGTQLSLIGGPRGGGGSNFTGSWSATGNGNCL